MDVSDEIVLLGSVATPKYVEPPVSVFGKRLVIPHAFVGLGDMSRGALLLRAVRDHSQLAYVNIDVLPVRRRSVKPKKPQGS